MKKLIALTDNSHVMSSHERAFVRVTSPTGKSVTMYKKNLSKKECTEEMKAAFWKCAVDPMVRYAGKIELTLDELRAVFNMSKL